MSSAIRVLIVDDSAVIRGILRELLSSEKGIEVVGTATDGIHALQKIKELNPDIMTLDIEMPGMNGTATLVEVRKIYPKLPVIMFSTLSKRGAVATLEALSLGATDYVTKPEGVSSAAEAAQRIKGELVPKIFALAKKNTALEQLQKASINATKATVSSLSPHRPTFSLNQVGIVAIGVSTGGPTAVMEIIPRLPKDFPVPIVIVQHMPADFTKAFADRIASISQVSVQEAAHGIPLLPGSVWVAPGGRHLVVERNTQGTFLAINDDPPENSCRPSVDVLFRSVANLYGPKTLAVMLTGMGSDGLKGSQDVYQAGGRIIVQDEATSVVWGMPGFVARAGIAEKILPLDAIAPEIMRRVGRVGAEVPRANG